MSNALTIPAAQQGAWLGLAAAKNNLTEDLTKRELELQGLLKGDKLEEIQNNLAAYRKKHAEMVEARKSFTNIINSKLIDPMMLWEKRSDPKVNESYLKLSNKELELRKKAKADADLQQNIATERAQFKAHFQNEYMALATKYRHALAQIAQQAYADCLHAKTPPDQVDSAIAVARLAMSDVKTGSPNKFVRTHLPSEEAAALYKQLQPPNWSGIKEEAQASLTEKFSLYANDLANAEAAIETSTRTFQAAIVEDIQDMAQEQAANVLMASAESFIISDVKGVKELRKILIKDDSEQWVVKIISAFLANFGTAFQKTKNKKYSSLSVAQMAAALDAAEIVVSGVEYQTIEK